jgi:hypothetical protein
MTYQPEKVVPNLWDRTARPVFMITEPADRLKKITVDSSPFAEVRSEESNCGRVLSCESIARMGFTSGQKMYCGNSI